MEFIVRLKINRETMNKRLGVEIIPQYTHRTWVHAFLFFEGRGVNALDLVAHSEFKLQNSRHNVSSNFKTFLQQEAHAAK